MNPSTSPKISNRFLEATFDERTGLLSELHASGGGEALVAESRCEYQVADPTSNSTTGRQGWALHNLSVSDGKIIAVMFDAWLRLTIEYHLAPDDPLLRVTLLVQPNSKEEHTLRCSAGLLTFVLNPSFKNIFDDPRDLCFDGAEATSPRAGCTNILPPWRVLYRSGYRDGLLIATPTKAEMAGLSIRERSIGICPHSRTNYQTTLPSPMELRPGRQWRSALLLGPWEASRHRRLLKLAGLNDAVTLRATSSGTRPKVAQGTIYSLSKLIPKSDASKEPDARKWLRVRVPWTRFRESLFRNPHVRAPAIRVVFKERGKYRLFLGVGNGKGAMLELPGPKAKQYPRIRLAPPWKNQSWDTGPLVSFLSGSHRSSEVDFGIVELTGKPLKIRALESNQYPTMLDYVRLERVLPSKDRTLPNSRKRHSGVALSGFADVPDIAMLTDAGRPDPAIYRANIFEHANCGFSRVYWRIDGQCSDYPSRVNTMRPISAKVHNVFSPQSKAYGRALSQFDMLRVAVESGAAAGIAIWGWMRFNSYIGNVQSEFFRQNPEYWEESDSGYRGRKLCIAIPQVRKHKIDIIVEAARYGLAGIQLGFLRQPPVLHYHPLLVSTFIDRYGKGPPRYASSPDQNFNLSVPPQDEPLHRLWYEHRASYLTLFGRELKLALSEHGLSHMPVSIWIRPSHCLFDGINLNAWLNEGLCQEVIINCQRVPRQAEPESNRLIDDIRGLIAGRARLVREVSYLQPWKDFKAEFSRVRAQGFDELCTYESNFAVLDDRCVRLYQNARR